MKPLHYTEKEKQKIPLTNLDLFDKELDCREIFDPKARKIAIRERAMAFSGTIDAKIQNATKAFQYLDSAEIEGLKRRFAAIGNKEQRVRECEKYCKQVNYSNQNKADLCGMAEPTYKRWKGRLKTV